MNMTPINIQEEVTLSKFSFKLWPLSRLSKMFRFCVSLQLKSFEILVSHFAYVLSNMTPKSFQENVNLSKTFIQIMAPFHLIKM